MALMAQAGIKQKGEHTHLPVWCVYLNCKWRGMECLCVRDPEYGEGFVLTAGLGPFHTYLHS